MTDKEFNWNKFHADLDMAVAISIEESKYPNMFLPSEVSLMKFMEIINGKRI